MLELEQWSNRILQLTQWTNRKQRGPQTNSVDKSPICYFSNMFSPKPCGKFQRRHFEHLKTRRGHYFFQKLFLFSKYLNSVSSHSAFKGNRKIKNHKKPLTGKTKTICLPFWHCVSWQWKNSIFCLIKWFLKKDDKSHSFFTCIKSRKYFKAKLDCKKAGAVLVIWHYKGLPQCQC